MKEKQRKYPPFWPSFYLLKEVFIIVKKNKKSAIVEKKNNIKSREKQDFIFHFFKT